jgi:hypothetical protein
MRCLHTCHSDTSRQLQRPECHQKRGEILSPGVAQTPGQVTDTTK